MAKKKKPRVAYDPVQTLRPVMFNTRFEDLTAEIHDLATKGSKPVWDKISPHDTAQDPEIRKKFYSLAHAGMRQAQARIIDIIRSEEPWPDSNIQLLHKLSDSIAWQMIGNQLCYARRFYKDQKLVDLNHSNFGSIIKAIEHHHQSTPDGFALISDLTSFVQVGDLLIADADGRFKIAEVKEGDKNHEIMEFMKFFMKSECPRALHYFIQEHGPQSLKQLQRMLRQATRMAHVTEIFNSGSSQDPDTEHKINIPEETIYIESWDKELNHILNISDTRGYALDTVDECLFIASYSRTSTMAAGHIMFNTWFDNCGGTPDCPRTRLIDCMWHPLALPIFNRDIADRHKLDILFGRKNVCIGLNIPALFKQLAKNGFEVRKATNKEASQMDQKGFPPYRFDGNAYYIGDGEKEVALMDGIFLRVMLHSQRPIETIKAVFNATSSMTQPT
ncbi:hypothetical protein [Pseudomonas shirazica]|uniref:hypothetical protein n=1 Tax=Pseudomonas shirazica TaxID=1940636 RepID=UPI001EDF9853|nr:hypothetical protein [Pseudomonas shirazica]